MAAIMSRDFANALLANSIASAPVALGPLNGAKVILFANNLAITEKTKLADLVEPTAAGYAKSAAVTWAGPVQNTLGNLEVYGDLKSFTFTANAIPDTIFGYAVEDSAGALLLLSELFETPITPQANEVIQVAPRFGLPDPVGATIA
jgi:hypothetical protein